jgi:branched-chain amino acid transport system substrate-binding protein
MARNLRIGLAALTVALAVGGCGGSDPEVRIGVLTDCQGPFRGFEEAMLSGAELPFLRRGARLVGTSPTDGVTTATVAGREVALVRGCSEIGEHTVFIEEARRLVEHERVDAIVGGSSVAMREVARLYPDVPFVATVWDESEVTLRRPAANLYRFSADFAQQTAGLGSYAFKELGWRRASVLAGDAPGGWTAAGAFAAEFCSLGGSVDVVYRSFYAPQPDVAERALRGEPDGLALLLTSFDSPTEVTGAVLQRLDDPARRLLLWAPLLEDQALLTTHAARLAGVAATSWLPAPPASATLADYRARYRAAFPGIPAAFADLSTVLGYHDSVEALLTALESIDADLSDRRRLLEQLARLELRLPRGTITLDANRQAVVDMPLVRLRSSGKRVALEPIRTVGNVEQSFGGLISAAPPPGPGAPACREATPPSWAR